MKITPKNYQEIAKRAYSVDSKYKDGEITRTGDKLILSNGTQWKVLKARENNLNGFQGMAVAPIVNREVDTSQVVIAYAGTSPSDWRDLAVDGANVMGSIGGLQLASANSFAKEVAKAYPYSDISTTGHSLGAFLALAQGAEHHWQSVSFNGPDPYNMLSSQATQWVKENPGMLTNFLNQADLVGYGGDIIARFKNGKLFWSALGVKINTTGSEVVLNYGFKGINPLDYHDIHMWQFDEEGNLLDGKGKRYGIPEQAVFNSKMNILSNSFKKQMKTLEDLKKRLAASGGALSSAEKIYLDSAQALAVVSTAGTEFNLALSKVMKLYQDGVKQAEEHWQETLSEAMSIGNGLDKWEVYEALEEVGFTHEAIVAFPTQLYQHKIRQVQQMSEKFKSLEREIKDKISEIVSRDQELAQQLKSS
ncbi:hypothetical protein [Lactococcus muris]|uniref:hypothetical protein n=2 Tax=Lactococcus muris TaxID=2941330 RepID=UPI00373FD3CD